MGRGGATVTASRVGSGEGNRRVKSRGVDGSSCAIALKPSKGSINSIEYPIYGAKFPVTALLLVQNLLEHQLQRF